MIGCRSPSWSSHCSLGFGGWPPAVRSSWETKMHRLALVLIKIIVKNLLNFLDKLHERLSISKTITKKANEGDL